jgi:hypothetical protein
MVVSTGVRYVVAPRGGGEDTHRAWEALYLGAVPIVKHSPIDSVFKDLPVHFVDECGTFGENLRVAVACRVGLAVMPVPLAQHHMTVHDIID